ncbi:unnamed protein product [Taenia asiatica]|uniref:Uncharacterized protein n=1 Tax=Taenia asiatica TaxID=60517 RepID=A0A0R3WDH9_TAEAS|nr:unnamed protein product [Taenia asiatica]
MKSVHHTSALLAVEFVAPTITGPVRHRKEANDLSHIVVTIGFVMECDVDSPDIPVNSVDESYSEVNMT